MLAPFVCGSRVPSWAKRQTRSEAWIWRIALFTCLRAALVIGRSREFSPFFRKRYSVESSSFRRKHLLALPFSSTWANDSKKVLAVKCRDPPVLDRSPRVLAHHVRDGYEHEARNPALAVPRIAGLRRGPTFPGRRDRRQSGSPQGRIRDDAFGVRPGRSREPTAAVGRDYHDLRRDFSNFGSGASGGRHSGHPEGLWVRRGSLADVPGWGLGPGTLWPAGLRPPATTTTRRTGLRSPRETSEGRPVESGI